MPEDRVRDEISRGAERRPARRWWPDGDAVMAVIVGGFLAYVYFGGSLYLQTIVIDSITVLVLAYSWNLISGYAGYFSFGQVAFYGIGGYAVAVLIVKANIGFAPAIVISALICVIVAVPTGYVLLRLRGIYFALGTLALYTALALIANNLGWVGAGVGLTIPLTASSNAILLCAIGIAGIAVAVAFVTAHSRLGLRAQALSADEDAIQVLGVNTMGVKLAMFAIAAGLAGLAGGVAAINAAFLTPGTAFSDTVNLQAIVFALIGGVGTVWGPVIGTGLSEAIISHFGPSAATEVQIALGVLIVIIVTLTPGGIVGLLNRAGLLRRKVMLRPRRPSRLVIAPGWLRRRPDASQAEVAGKRTKRTVLSAKGVSVHFSGVTAVDNVTVEVAAGEFLAIIGANGAGKTTLFNAISGFARRSGGSLRLGDTDVTMYGATELARAGISRTFQIPRLAERLTVWENVMLGSLMDSGLAEAQDRAGLIIKEIGLGDVAYEPVERLGPGTRRRVEIARVVATRPRVVLLDEALAGMSAAEVAEVRHAVAALRDWGVEAVVSIEHVLSAVRDLADRMVALDFGKVVAEGTPEEVLAHEHVVTSYLGTGMEAHARPADRPRRERGEAEPLLTVSRVVAGYGSVRVLWDISIDLWPGELVGVLGASGAGKTTLCRAITGSCSVHSGRVLFSSADMTGRAPHLVTRAGISYVPSGRELFYDLSAEDNLRLGAVSSRGAAVEEPLARVLDLFPEIRPLLGNRAGSLSGGQQQMVAIGRALMRSPEILVLDEPSTGLAPIVVSRLMDALHALADAGMAVLVVEQNAVETLRAVSRAYVLQEGRVVFGGTSEELQGDPRLARAYLGADTLDEAAAVDAGGTYDSSR